jgi:hypothetical protein
MSKKIGIRATENNFSVPFVAKLAADELRVSVDFLATTDRQLV